MVATSKVRFGLESRNLHWCQISILCLFYNIKYLGKGKILVAV
jgi:hypothetical protein